MANLHKLLGQTSFWIVNKYLARYFGDNDMALFISDMVDKQGYHTANNQLVEGKWWYSTAESTYEDTNIPVKRRQGYIQELQKRDILEVKKMGLPCKTYFNVNMGNLEKLLETILENEPNKFSQNDQTVMAKTTKQVSSKRPNILYNNNKVIIIKDNNKGKKERKKEGKKLNFVTDEEVKKLLSEEGKGRGYIETFVAYWEIRRLKNKTANTRSSYELIRKKLNKHEEQIQIKMIERSIENGWQGLFEIQDRNNYSNQLVGAQEKSKYKTL